MIYIQVIILKNLAPTTYGICNGTFVTVKGLLYENDDNFNKWLLPVCVFVNDKEFGNYFGEILISKISNFHSIDDKLLIDIERPGVTYTAFSSATSLDSILLLPPSGNDRLI